MFTIAAKCGGSPGPVAALNMSLLSRVPAVGLAKGVRTPDDEADGGRDLERGMCMFTTRWSMPGLLMLTLGLVLAVALAPAVADTVVFEDPVGDSTSVDISRVRVVHRDAVVVRVRSEVPLAAGQLYAFWIDAGDGPQPDYYVDFRANSGYDEVLRLVRSFADRRSNVECRGLRLRADIFSNKPVSVRIPRRCLGDPRRVRVAVQFQDESTGAVDWAADRRTFGPWVNR